MFEMVESSALTHVGMVRTRNEDSFLERPEIGLWAVADGMGGHDAGDVASALVVEQLRLIPAPASPADLLHQCAGQMRQANDEIRAAAAARGQGVMGTTVAILLVSGPYYACLWSGDSRIYRVRAQGITQLTRDHSEAQEMVDKGILSPEDARQWPRKNIITRAIGIFPEVDLELRHGEIETGDVFVLCSDGLTAHVEDAEIAALVSSGPAQEVARRLVETVLDRGAQDNVTVIVVRFVFGERTVIAPDSAQANGQGWS